MGKSILLIALGGGLGSAFRYTTGLFIDRYIQSSFPWATFTVNFVGCFILGLLISYFGKYTTSSIDIKLLFTVGFCGGFTTFSTFAFENLTMIQNGNYGLALLYTLASLLLGIIAVWLGFMSLKLL